MIQTLQIIDGESTAYNCLRLIERCAAKFLKMGGGGVAAEHPWRASGKRCSAEKVEQIVAKARTGKYTSSQLGEMFGVRQSSVFKMAQRRGITMPDGRLLRRMLG
jgi:hypothetical protein